MTIQTIEHVHGSIFVDPGLPRDKFFYLLGDMPARYPVPAIPLLGYLPCSGMSNRKWKRLLLLYLDLQNNLG